MMNASNLLLDQLIQTKPYVKNPKWLNTLRNHYLCLYYLELFKKYTEKEISSSSIC